MLHLNKISLLICCSFLFISINAQQPKLVMQKGHTEPITAIAFNIDGTIMATGSEDKLIKLIDPQSGYIYHTFRGHSRKISNVLFSNDKKYLISSSFNEVICWDLETEKELFRTRKGIKYEDKDKIAISPDSRYLAFNLSLIDLKNKEHRNGKNLIKIGLEGRNKISNIKFSPDGKTIILGGATTTSVWDIATQTTIHTIGIGQKPRVSWINANKNEYYTANDYLNWQIWDLASGKYKDTYEGTKGNQRQLGWNETVIYNRNHTILGISNGSIFSFYNLQNGEFLRDCIETISDKEKYDRIEFTAAAFNPGGELLVTAMTLDHSQEVVIRYYDVESGREIRTKKSYQGGVDFVEFSPDDKKLAIAGSGAIKIWELGKAVNAVTNLAHTKDKNGSWNPNHLFWSPDSRVLLNYSYTGNDSDKLTEVVTGNYKDAFGHFYYKYGHNIKHRICLSNDFKILAESNRVSNFETGELICDYDLDKDFYRKDIGEKVGKYEYPTIITPDNKTLVVAKWMKGSFINLTFVNLESCKKSNFISIPNNRSKSKSKTEYEYHLIMGGLGKKLAIVGDDIFIVDIVTRDLLFSIPSEFKDEIGNRKASINMDETLVAVGGTDNLVHIWDIATKKEIYTLEGHIDDVTSVSFMHNKNVLASTSLDNSIIIWDIDNRKQLARMATVNANDYVVVTPDNYYFATKDGLKNAAFRFNDKILPFEQFDLKYNRPDIVIKRLGTAKSYKLKMFNKAYQKRLNRSGFTEDMLDDNFNLPIIEIIGKYQLLSSTSQQEFKFSINASDKLYNLDRIKVYINDVPVFKQQGIDLKAENLKSLTKELTVELSQGVNKISVSVLNSSGVESVREEFEVAYDKPTEKPDLYVLTIGISEYESSERNLTYAAKDAGDIASILKTSTQYGKVNVRTVLNKDATRDNILKEAEFLKEANIDDHVIIYISSHGLLDDNLDYFLATTDVVFEDPSGKGLPYEELEKILDVVKSRNRLILIDACHSGEVDKEDVIFVENTEKGNVNSSSKSGGKMIVPKVGLKNSFAYMQELFTDVSKGVGATVISAAGGLEFAYETKDQQNGIFTYAFVKGIESMEADLNKDGKIQLSELQSYIVDQVTTLTDGKQVPTIRKINDYNNFILK